MESAVWSPSNYQIAYFKASADYASLFIFDASKAKSKPQELAKFRVQDVSLRWERPGQILLVEKNSASLLSAVWMYNTKSNTLTLISEGLGLESIWSETSTHIGLVFSAARSGRGGALSLTDSSGNSLARLRLATLPRKCAFGMAEITPNTSNAASSSPPAKSSPAPGVLYCAVPRDTNKFSRARLPDDYAKKALFTEDDIYQVDLSQGNAVPVFTDGNQSFDASNLKVFGQNLFFVNRLDSRVYAVSLK